MALGSNGRRIVVEFIGDASALKSGIGQGEQALQGFSGKAQAAGRIAGKALAGGLLLAGAAAISATQAAADDEAAQSQLAQQLRQAAGATDSQIASTEDWITAQGKATGISDDDLRPALAKLATATGSVTKAQQLAALAMDVSAGSGKSYQQVTEALAKAQNGNIGALGRLGIATKDSAGHTKTLAQITDDLSNKYKGSAAAAAQTTAGKQKILTTQFKELQEQIGTNLLPVMIKLADVGLKVVNWISHNTTTVGVLIGVMGSLLAITTAVGYATKVWAVLSGAASVAIGAHAAVTGADTAALEGNRIALVAHAAISKVAAAGQWLLNAAMSANPIGLVVIAIAALVAGLILAYKHSETFRNIVNAAFGAVAKAAGVAVDFIRDHWKLILAILTGPIGIAVGLIAGHWSQIKAGAAAVIDWVQAHWPPLRDRIVGPFQAAKQVVGDVFGDIKAGFGVVRDHIADAAGAIRDKVSSAFGAVKSVVQGVIDTVQNLIDKIEAFIKKLASVPHPDLNPFNRSSSSKAGTGGGGGAVGDGTKDAIAAAAGVGSRASADGAGGSPVTPVVININGALDPLAVARQVEQMLRKLERTTGRKLLVAPA